jgi:hypothetical protein
VDPSGAIIVLKVGPVMACSPGVDVSRPCVVVLTTAHVLSMMPASVPRMSARLAGRCVQASSFYKLPVALAEC